MTANDISSEHCQALFEEFNHRYFDGRLSHYRVVVVERSIPGDYALVGFCYRSRQLILIRRQASETTLVGILLHEMAHAVTPPGHGSAWRAEMERLKQAGAPIIATDIEHPYGDADSDMLVDTERELSQIPDSQLVLALSVTREFIRQLAEEFFEGGIDHPLRQFIRLLVTEQCIADSQAELLSRYPWIPLVFSNAKKKARQEEQRGSIFKAALKTKRTP